MELIVLISVVIFVSTFIQTVSGFGIALVAMPILTSAIGLGVASPLVALVAFATRIGILLRYHQAFSLRAVVPLVIASVIGVQFGGALLNLMDEHTMKVILGLVIISYAVYALFKLKLPAMAHSTWAYSMGFLSGVLAGAYNAGGPPVVIYADCRGWNPDEFKSNLQGFAMFNSVTVLLNQLMNGRFTPLVWQTFLLTIPAAAIGLWLGIYADKLVNGERFRTVVLVLLLALGVQLLF
ncbi:MAG: sulfite exporter TauE/SafE family protein [Anaerolineae bacterium]